MKRVMTQEERREKKRADKRRYYAQLPEWKRQRKVDLERERQARKRGYVGRKCKSAEEKAETRAASRTRAKARYAAMPREQRQALNKRATLRKRQRRATESPETRRQRLDKRNAAARRRYASNPEKRQKAREYNTEYKRAHPEWRARKRAERRARKRGAQGKVSARIRTILRVRQGGKCVYCKTRLSPLAHLDHIVPLAKGGSHTEANVQLLCPTCNVKKSARDESEFAREWGMLL